MESKVSIVIPAYNREKYIADAIESVLAQTYKNLELIVWDDGSTDETLYIAARYVDDRRVKVISFKHQGLGYSLKTVIAKTTGDYVGWVDSDDWLHRDAIKHTVAVLDQNPEVGMVYTDYFDVDETGRNCLGYGELCSIPYSPDNLLHRFMTHHFRLMRRSVYDIVGGVDDTLKQVHDYDLCLKLSEVTEIFHLQKLLYYYRHHEDMHSVKDKDVQTQESEQVVLAAMKRRGIDGLDLADRFYLLDEPERFID